MKAIVLTAPGDANNLEVQEINIPSIKQGELLIKVEAFSINPVDIKTRNGNGIYGRIMDDQPLILGWDISGIVTESRHDAFKTGDEVFGMVNFPGHGKAYAQYVAAPASQLVKKPKNISHEQAAAATLVALTAWQALVTNAKIQKGQKILIHAASGGVGHLAVQIAKYLGATVIGTSSLKNKDFVLKMGADDHIDYHNYNWSAQPKEFDIVLDTIGGENIEHSLKVTKKGGRIISIPTGLKGEIIEKAADQGVEAYFILVESNGEDMAKIAALLQEGILKPQIFKTYEFNQIKKAHQQQETGRTVGKLIVTT